MGDLVTVRIEYEHDGDLVMARPHRQFFGRGAVAEPILFKIDYEETEPLFGCIEVDDSEGTPGRSARTDRIPGFVLTAEPQNFGTDADRLAAGKHTFVQLPFGEWSIMNRAKLGW
jgi:hypothetical protein